MLRSASGVPRRSAFLRQRVETRLASLPLDAKDYQPAPLLTSLYGVKRLDDKAQLVEIHLLESRAHLALRNMPKSKAGLTAARTAANAIYVPPSMRRSSTPRPASSARRRATSARRTRTSSRPSSNSAPWRTPPTPCALKYMLLCR